VLWISSNNDFFFLVVFFYRHSIFVKVMDVIIFHCVHKFAFCVECSKVIVVSVRPYSCALCRVWRTYADSGLFDMM
jgi:hypothetical protein